MNDHQTDKSKFASALTADLPEFGRALLIGAVEFSHSGLWTTEHYVIPPENAPIRGCSLSTHFNTISTPAEILPKPSDELSQAMVLAEGALGQLLFQRDRELCRLLRPTSQHVNRDVLPSALAIMYLQGEFTEGLQAIHGNTECKALAAFLSDVFRLPKFAIKKTGPPS